MDKAEERYCGSKLCWTIASSYNQLQMQILLSSPASVTDPSSDVRKIIGLALCNILATSSSGAWAENKALRGRFALVVDSFDPPVHLSQPIESASP